MSEHGTQSRYTNQKCRCIQCRQANADTQRRQRTQRAKKDIPAEKHGRRSTYINYRCRCDPCTQAQLDYNKQYTQAANR